MIIFFPAWREFCAAQQVPGGTGRVRLATVHSRSSGVGTDWWAGVRRRDGVDRARGVHVSVHLGYPLPAPAPALACRPVTWHSSP